jgi:putative transposase
MKKKRFTEEQIVGMLRQAEQSEQTVTQVCKAYGVSEQTWYRWKKRFGQMGVPDVRRLRTLEKENSRLKRLVAERDLEIDAMQEVLRRNF